MNDVTFPLRLRENILVQNVASETLLYDERRHLAFCLNPTAAAVWNLCDGAHSVSQISIALTTQFAEPVSEDVVLIALAQLRRDGLLVATPATPAMHLTPSVLSRRSMVGQMGVGTALLLPFVAAIAAPRAAQAYNGCVNCSSAKPNGTRRPGGLEH